MTRREFYRIAAVSAGVTTVVGGAIYAHARWHAPYQLVTTRHEVELSRLDTAFAGFKVVQLTDLHLDSLNSAAVENEVVQRVAVEQPNLIVLTGDYTTHWSGEAMERLETFVARLGASCPKVATLGNHDYWGGQPLRTCEALKRGGATVLVDDIWELRLGGATLTVLGLDDLWQGPPPTPVWDVRPRLERLLAMATPGATTLLLVHEPDFADVAGASARIAWQLSGHSHGGQIAPPYMGPPRLPPLGVKYPSGWYRVQDTQLYTSSGVGLVPPLVRHNCSPEVAVFTLRVPRQDRA